MDTPALMEKRVTAPQTHADMAGGGDQYLTFILAGEEYGVDILRVQEIKGWDRATPVPNTPDYICGVINLRGAIVPVVDLHRCFGMEEMSYGPATVVIVLKVVHEAQERTIGIVVDAVSDVYDIRTDGAAPPPDFVSLVNREAVKGLATVDEKMVILLDIDQLISTGVLEQDETARRLGG